MAGNIKLQMDFLCLYARLNFDFILLGFMGIIKGITVKRYFFAALAFLCGISAANASLPYVGMYQTIDDVSGQPKSIVALYEYTDGDDTELAGRIVAIYGADGAVITSSDKSKYIGMDIIWDMEWDLDDNKYEDGKIMDPTSGKVYSSVIWQDRPGELNVRGKIGPFGRTQKWNHLTGTALPGELNKINTENWKPATGK